MLSLEQCLDLIEFFEEQEDIQTKGHVQTDGVSHVDPSFKVSTDIGFDNESFFKHPRMRNLLNAVEKCFKQYCKQYGLQELGLFHASNMNLQRYLPGEGFYRWHAESTGVASSDIELVWMVYLNDIDPLTDNGGTYFKYQKWLEAAEAGKVVIWPSAFTHTHRGQCSKTKTKYIATGWFTFT